MTTETKLRCSECGHLSTDEDMVMLYGVAGREQALCVDNIACRQRISNRGRKPVTLETLNETVQEIEEEVKQLQRLMGVR